MAYEQLRKLKWFIGAGAQELCFEHADANGDPIWDLYIKFNESAFACVPRALVDSGALAELLHVVHPPHVTPRLPCLLTMARNDREDRVPCVRQPLNVHFDIEWYEDTERSIESALEIIFRAWRQVEDLMDDEWDHDCGPWMLYISECCRFKRGKWYNSFHITARCPNDCAFVDFDHMKRFTNRMFHRFDQLPEAQRRRYFLANGGTSLIFDRIYTSNRAFRMPYCSKMSKDGEYSKPMRILTRDVYPGAPPDHERFERHLHTLVYPGFTPFPDVAVLEGNRCQRTGRRPPQHLPVVHDDAMIRYYDHLVADRDLHYDARSHSFRSRAEGLDGVFSRLIDRPAYRPETLTHYRPYQHWFQVSVKLATFLPRELGYDLWIKFAQHFDKDDSAAGQWQRTLAWIESRPDAYLNLEQRRYSFLDEFSRHERLDWRTFLPADAPDYPCPLGEAVYHPRPIRLDLIINPLQMTIVECSQCRRRQCWGLPCEGTNVRLFRSRYVSDDAEALADLQRVVREHAPNQRRRTLVYACPMGTGKSHLFTEAVKWDNDKVSVCITLSRRLLCDALCHALQKKALPDLLHYIQDKRTIKALHSWERSTPADRSYSVATVLDSLPRTVNRGGRTPRFDVVVLEEIESLLAHCSSDTIGGGRRRVYDALHRLVSNATVVVALDADFGERAHRFLLETRFDTALRIHRNLETPLGRRHYLYHQASAFFSRLLYSVVHQRKKIFIIANVKNELQAAVRIVCERWVEQHPDEAPLNVLVLTADSNAADKRGVRDASIEWLAYDIVAWSPVIDSGVDFNPSVPYFELGFELYRKESSCIRSLEQQAARVRQLVPGGSMHVYIDSRDTRPIEHTCIETLYNHHLENLDRLPERSPYRASITRERVRESVLPFDSLTRVLLANELEARASNEDPVAVYQTYCDIHGHTVERVYDFPPDIPYAYSVDERLVRLITREVYDDDTDALRDSQRIMDMGDAMELVQNQEQAPEPHAIRKEMMCRLLGVDDIVDKEIIEFLKRPDFASLTLTFMLLFGDEAASHYYTKTLYALEVECRDVSMDFGAYIDKLEIASNHPLKSKLEVQRASLIRDMMGRLGLTTDNILHARVRAPLIDALHASFFTVKEVKEALLHHAPRTRWDLLPEKPQHRATRAKQLFAMANLTLRSRRGRAYAIDEDSVRFMMTIAALLLPASFAHWFRENNKQPMYFEEKIIQASLA